MFNFLSKLRGSTDDSTVTHSFQTEDGEGFNWEMFSWFSLHDAHSIDVFDPNFPMTKAYDFWRNNALAKRLVNFTRDIVVSKGITVTSDNEELNEVFEKFQKNAENMWLRTVQNLSNLKMIFGETCIEPIINPADGSVTLNPLAPTNINQVKRDPKNNNFDVSFVYNYSIRKRQTYQVLRPYMIEGLPKMKMMGKSAFFWKHNTLFNETRGNPDLLPVFDFLQAHKNLHLDLRSQIRRHNWILCDATIKNWPTLSKKQKKAKVEAIADTIRKGGVMAHGEGDSYEFKTPQFSDFDIKNIELAFLKYICNAFGFPLHYFATPDNSNRATAQEMDYPTEISMVSHQNTIVQEVEMIAHFVKWAWLTSDRGRFAKDSEDMTTKVDHPTVSSRLTMRQGQAVEKFLKSIDENCREIDEETRLDLKLQVLKTADFTFDKMKVLENKIPVPDPVEKPDLKIKKAVNAS